MIYLLPWYLTISILGWLSFPLAYRLLPALADRGYTISRALGLMLWSYLFWLLASLGVLQNDTGGLLLPLGLLTSLSIWSLRSNWRQLRDWFAEKRSMVIVTEILFLAAFIGWAIVRGYNPEAVGTEKPMELAFINAILNSPTFPPHDPWLSGYAISYYYFGFVMVAMIAKLTATSGAVAFNLGLALVFALGAAGSYGLVYNLLAAYLTSSKRENRSPDGIPYLPALLGPLFVLFASNLEGFLHSLHTRGIFWQRAATEATSGLVSPFWEWLDIKDLNLPPAEPFSWMPTRFWWWWRGSRVLQDYDLANNVKEIINEFPFFSFLLGDLHPHVLAIPFAFLAITLSLNLYLGGGSGRLNWFWRRFNLQTLAWTAIFSVSMGIVLLALGAGRMSLGIVLLSIMALGFGAGLIFALRKALVNHGLALLMRDDLGKFAIGRKLEIRPTFFVVSGIVLGGTFFLNAWDFPFYVALFAGAYLLHRTVNAGEKLAGAIKDFVWLGLLIGLSGGLFYLPFYLSFSSQAGGLLPNLIYPTRGAHLWVMFAPLLLPIFAFLIHLIRQYLAPEARLPKLILRALGITLGLFLLLWLAANLFGFAILSLPELGDFYLSVLGGSSSAQLFQASITRRFGNSGGWLTMAALFTLVLAVFLHLLNRSASPEKSDQKDGRRLVFPDYRSENPEFVSLVTGESAEHHHSKEPFPALLPRAHIFALLIILLGGLLVLGPEFFYLRDQFGWRINTIFKFYYQAWLLWAIAAAYASLVLFNSKRGLTRLFLGIGLALVIGASLVYPVFGLINKTNNFAAFEATLDGSIHMEGSSPDELAAIRWLQQAPPGIIAEGVPETGGSYSNFARQATHSGKPNLLGWVGHESQWRGGGEEMGSRKADLETLYCSRDWKTAQDVVIKYNIRYIVVGPLERSAYQANSGACPVGVVETKFPRFLQAAFQQGGITIYEYTEGVR